MCVIIQKWKHFYFLRNNIFCLVFTRFAWIESIFFIVPESRSAFKLFFFQTISTKKNIRKMSLSPLPPILFSFLLPLSLPSPPFSLFFVFSFDNGNLSVNFFSLRGKLINNKSVCKPFFCGCDLKEEVARGWKNQKHSAFDNMYQWFPTFFNSRNLWWNKYDH